MKQNCENIFNVINFFSILLSTNMGTVIIDVPVQPRVICQTAIINKSLKNLLWKNIFARTPMCIFVLISQQKQWTKKNHFNFSILNTFCNEILAIPIVFALDAFCQCQTHLDPQVILIAKYNVFYSTRSNTRINTFGFVLLKILILTHINPFQVISMFS